MIIFGTNIKFHSRRNDIPIARARARSQLSIAGRKNQLLLLMGRSSRNGAYFNFTASQKRNSRRHLKTTGPLEGI
jgi:hypothetical protein